jgi:hypothetical protein
VTRSVIGSAGDTRTSCDLRSVVTTNGHHADHRCWRAINPHCAADDEGIPRVASLPETVTEYRYSSGAGYLVGRYKISSGNRSCPYQLEVVISVAS